MGQILLDEEVKRVQVELRRLALYLRNVKDYELLLNYNEAAPDGTLTGTQIEVHKTIKNHLKELFSKIEVVAKRIGADNGNIDYDESLSIIENIGIVNQNATSITNRLNNIDNNILPTLALKTTTDALQADINNILAVLASQVLWTGTENVNLSASDNTHTLVDASLKAAIAGLTSGKQVIIKIEKADASQLAIYLDESVSDQQFTSNKFYSDNDVQVRLNATQFIVNGLVQQERGQYRIKEVRTAQAGATINLNGLAKIDLTNVNVGVANAGKFLRVKANGGIEEVELPTKQWVDITNDWFDNANYDWKPFIGYDIEVDTKEQFGKLYGTITNQTNTFFIAIQGVYGGRGGNGFQFFSVERGLRKIGSLSSQSTTQSFKVNINAATTIKILK